MPAPIVAFTCEAITAITQLLHDHKLDAHAQMLALESLAWHVGELRINAREDVRALEAMTKPTPCGGVFAHRGSNLARSCVLSRGHSCACSDVPLGDASAVAHPFIARVKLERR